LGQQTRIKYQYCTGYDAQCSGSWSGWGVFGEWAVAKYCGSGQTCSATYGTCQTNSSCQNNNIYTKGCYNGNLHWFDRYGQRTSLYKNCSDGNSCTIDTCDNASCKNELKCDGATCAKGSDDYCKKCTHCGDGVLNCGETQCTCVQDFVGKQNLVLSFLAKKTSEPTEWRESLTAGANNKVDFMMIVTNGTGNSYDNVQVRADMPSDVIYEDDLKVDGNNFAGDIRNGVYIGQIPAGKVKTITFRGRIASANELSGVNATVNGAATVNNLSAQDSVEFTLQYQRAAAAGIWMFFTNWILWFVLLLLVLLVLLFRWFFNYWYENKKLTERVA
jgi:hypothetical protein